MKSPSKILFPQTTTPTKTTTQHPVVSPDSVTQDFSFTQGDIAETVLTSNVTKCPKLTSVVKETKSQFEPTTTTYITRVQYRKKVPSSPNVIDMMKTLAACFMQYNTTVQILPYDDACKSNPIITPRDIPTEVDEFALYVPHATVSRRNVLFMKFRIKSDMSLFKLKKVRGIMNYLERWSIYLDQMYLKSSDTVKIGGFLMSHCQYTRKEQANDEINERLNMDEALDLEVQLTPHYYWHGSGGNRVSTRLLAIECARSDTKEIRERIYRKMMQVPDSLKYGNTRYFHYIPFSATTTMSDDSLRNGVMLQNKFLLAVTDVQIKNISNAEWTVPNDTRSFKEMILEVTQKNSGTEKLFINVEKASGIDKIHLVTTKENFTEAREWVDKFIFSMENLNLSSQEWQQLTKYTTVFTRIDMKSTTDAEKAYSAGMIKELNIGGVTMNALGPIKAPPRQAWKRALYGPDESVHDEKSGTMLPNNPTIQPTVTLQPSQAISKEDITKKIEEMTNSSLKTFTKEKDDLLNEVREMNATSDKRTSNLESLVVKNDQIMRELILHNKKTTDEVGMQQSNMVAMNTILESLAVKGDKMQTTMSMFMQRMADSFNAISPNNSQNSIQTVSVEDLTEFLQDDDKMDIDSVLGTSKPPPAAEIGLRGGGERK